MADTLELSELAFTADEIDKTVNAEICGETVLNDDNCKDVAFVLNRILAEKLGRAPEVFGSLSASQGECPTWSKREPGWYDTHTARLVCVEKIVL